VLGARTWSTNRTRQRRRRRDIVLEDPPTPAPGRRSSIGPDAGIFNLDRLIFIVMESRSFDHYFGTFPGADGFPRRAGQHRRLLPDPDGPPSASARIGPQHDRSRRAARGIASTIDITGKMNGFVRALRLVAAGA
jgi:phospholipase C